MKPSCGRHWVAYRQLDPKVTVCFPRLSGVLSLVDAFVVVPLAQSSSVTLVGASVEIGGQVIDLNSAHILEELSMLSIEWLSFLLKRRLEAG